MRIFSALIWLCTDYTEIAIVEVKAFVLPPHTQHHYNNSMFSFAMDPSRPRPPAPPIPSNTAVPSNIGAASGSSAPAASLVTEKPDAGSTGQGVIHFMKTILDNFRTKRWSEFYLSTHRVRIDTVHCPIGSGTPAKCTVSNLSDRDHEVQNIMFNPYCLESLCFGIMRK